jgi:hypothetical protein
MANDTLVCFGAAAGAVGYASADSMRDPTSSPPTGDRGFAGPSERKARECTLLECKTVMVLGPFLPALIFLYSYNQTVREEEKYKKIKEVAPLV